MRVFGGSFASIDGLWNRVIEEILSFGIDEPSRDGRCRELIGMTVALNNIDRAFLRNPARDLSAGYAAAETLWYLSGESDVAMLLPHAPSYARFASPATREAHGAYGPRVMSQLGLALSLLTKEPGSRQAVIPVFQPRDLIAAASADRPPDIPCTTALTFFIRGGRLHLHVTMRSNDAWMGLPYDVFAFTCIQRAVASMLDRLPGEYVHSATSLHLYDRHRDKAKEAIKMASPLSTPLGWGDRRPGASWSASLRSALALERAQRERQPIDPLALETLQDTWPMLGDLAAAAMKLPTRSPALRKKGSDDNDEKQA